MAPTTQKKGKAFLMTNAMPFKMHKEIRNKEGVYALWVKGSLTERLSNVCAPPETTKGFLKTI